MKRTLTLIAIATLFSLGNNCRAGFAQVPQAIHASESDFIPVYKRYVDTLNREGWAGLRKIATPDFVTFSADGSKRISGLAAFAEVTKCFDVASGKPKGNVSRQYTACFSVSHLSDQEALIYTEEIQYSLIPWNIIYSIQLPNDGHSLGESVTWMISWRRSTRWKQTWKKTADGWKLASLDLDTRTEAEREAQDTFRCVVKSDVLNPLPEKRIPPTP